MARFNFGTVSPVRRRTMQAIKGKDTTIEIAVRRELFKRGYRYRVNYSKLPGRPDIAFVSQKIAIFCDSEFWHGRGWQKRKKKIATNRLYWIPKIEGNIRRDKKINNELRRLGWNVLRFWENDIKKNISGIIALIEIELNKMKNEPS